MKGKMLRFEGDLDRHQKQSTWEATVEDRVRGGIQVQLYPGLLTLSREGTWGQEDKDAEMF